MANMDIDAGSGELADVAGGLEVRAAHRVAALMQHQRDAAHTGAANANEMRALKRGRLGCLGYYDVRHAYSS